MAGRAISLSCVLMGVALAATAWTATAWAQPAGTASLTQSQELGRILTSQSCVVCHFPLQRGAHTYGPRLSRESAGGDDTALREIIGNGTPRMPGFKYMFNDDQMSAVIQYIKTLPPGPDTQKKD